MSSALAKLNLRPQERRLIAFVAIVLFVVLNMMFIWPLFGDWEKLQAKKERTRTTLATYQNEIAKAQGYQVKLRELESAGSSVVPEEQELDLVRRVDNQARLNGLTIIQSAPRPGVSAGSQTNRFFEEQYHTLHVTSGNEELVNFLMSLTSTNSLIRVKDLTLKTDPGGTRLDGSMTLVASYQRKAPSRTQTAPAPTTLAANKPVPPRSLPQTNRPAGSTVRSNVPTRVMPTRPRMTNQPVKTP